METCFSLSSLSLICCTEAVPSALSFSSEDIVLSVSVNSLCSWEEVSSGSSCAAILDWKPAIILLKYKPDYVTLVHKTYTVFLIVLG